MSKELHICCAIADQERFDANLGRSPDLLKNGGTIPIITRWGCKNVPAAYNDMLVCVKDYTYTAFIHEDVFLPAGWAAKLLEGIKKVGEVDPEWDVIGVAGALWVEKPDGVVEKKYAGNYHDRGKVSMNEVWLPVLVETVDEIVVVTRTGRKFDELNPYHHLMGADLCWRSKGVYVVDAWCEHNCKGAWKTLPMEFAVSAGYFWGKHQHRLPLLTNCATISKANGVCSIVA